MTTEELQAVRVNLKSGEYDGVDVMKAWLAIDELIQARKTIKLLTKNEPDFEAADKFNVKG